MQYSGTPSFVYLYVVFIPRELVSFHFSGIARPTYLQSPFPPEIVTGRYLQVFSYRRIFRATITPGANV